MELEKTFGELIHPDYMVHVELAKEMISDFSRKSNLDEKMNTLFHRKLSGWSDKDVHGIPPEIN